MNPSEVLRIVDAIHRDKKIDKSIVIAGIESALVTAARKHFGEDALLSIIIDPETGEMSGSCDGVLLTQEELEQTGRIDAQTAKQVMIQKIREAERDSLYEQLIEDMDQMITGIVQKVEGSTLILSLGNNIEAILPRSEKIPGDLYHIGDRVRAVIVDVRKSGTRVKVVVSRTRPLFVKRLFEQEVPEIADGTIEVKEISREPGYRTKIAVASIDPRIESKGACVGIRGSRIKNVNKELGNERVDVVQWSDDMQVFIPNALQPAEVEEVILCSMLGRAVVLVKPDQRSLAIGRKGQNVRLASKLCGWDIDVRTREDLENVLETTLGGYLELEGMTDELADLLVAEGFLSFDDLSIIEPDDLMSLGNLDEETAAHIIEQAEERAEEEENQKNEAGNEVRDNEVRSNEESAEDAEGE
ncbi:MAG: transcription termination factor NusA [Planctomycetaceae bacterium]|jgi:N utilization substance protein A|nr:transcription termination factor NusA [Planctomycetaceae bacterium]